MPTESGDPIRDSIGESLTAGLAAFASSGSFTNSVLGFLTPIMTKALQRAFGEVGKRHEQRISTLMNEASAVSGEQALVDAINSDADRRELTVDTAYAATQVRLPHSVRAMGRALAQGLLNDGTSPDVARFIIDALKAIQPVHAAVLDKIGQSTDKTSVEEIKSAMPHLAEVLTQALAILSREGLIEEQPKPRTIASPGGPTGVWRLTEFGRTTLTRLYEVGYESGAEVS